MAFPLVAIGAILKWVVGVGGAAIAGDQFILNGKYTDPAADTTQSLVRNVVKDSPTLKAFFEPKADPSKQHKTPASEFKDVASGKTAAELAAEAKAEAAALAQQAEAKAAALAKQAAEESKELVTKAKTEVIEQFLEKCEQAGGMASWLGPIALRYVDMDGENWQEETIGVMGCLNYVLDFFGQSIPFTDVEPDITQAVASFTPDFLGLG